MLFSDIPTGIRLWLLIKLQLPVPLRASHWSSSLLQCRLAWSEEPPFHSPLVWTGPSRYINSPLPSISSTRLTLSHNSTMAIESLRLNVDKLPPADAISNATSQPLPPLLRLPVELHLEIISYLSGDRCCRVFDRLALRLVNRYLYYGLDAPSLDQLRALETSACGAYYKVFVCRYCLCLRRADKFVDKILKGNCGKDWAGDKWGQKDRWCADCGFDKRNPIRYPRGVHIMVNGIPWLHCIGCDEIKKGIAIGMTACKELCKDCLARYGCLYIKDYPKRPKVLREQVKRAVLISANWHLSTLVIALGIEERVSCWGHISIAFATPSTLCIHYFP